MERSSDCGTLGGKSAGGRDSDPMCIPVPAFVCRGVCRGGLPHAVPACDLENDCGAGGRPDSGLCASDSGTAP